MQSQSLQLARQCDIAVVSPVPYCPPFLERTEYARFRKIETMREEHEVRVFYPRFLLPPGYRLHSLEATVYYAGIRGLCDRLWSDLRPHLIHAHFSYPDGVAAVMLGRRYGIPVVVTEHAFWRPWLEHYPLVRSQTLWAARKTNVQIAVSPSLRDVMASFTGRPERIRVIPNGVDPRIYTSAEGSRFKREQILFVGFINFVKGVDVLLRAFRELSRSQPHLRLIMIGGGHYRDTRLHSEDLRRQASAMGIGDKIEFLGTKMPHEVARYMRESTMLVLPSRRETFGSVLIEAMACGTPVVATRCGGPESIVTDEVGLLVNPDDPSALLEGIELMIRNRDSYQPETMRQYALRNFSLERVARETMDAYREAIVEPDLWRSARSQSDQRHMPPATAAR